MILQTYVPTDLCKVTVTCVMNRNRTKDRRPRTMHDWSLSPVESVEEQSILTKKLHEHDWILVKSKSKSKTINGTPSKRREMYGEDKSSWDHD